MNSLNNHCKALNTLCCCKEWFDVCQLFLMFCLIAISGFLLGWVIPYPYWDLLDHKYLIETEYGVEYDGFKSLLIYTVVPYYLEHVIVGIFLLFFYNGYWIDISEPKILDHPIIFLIVWLIGGLIVLVPSVLYTTLIFVDFQLEIIPIVTAYGLSLTSISYMLIYYLIYYTVLFINAYKKTLREQNDNSEQNNSEQNAVVEV